jgi:hypothetical protein
MSTWVVIFFVNWIANILLIEFAALRPIKKIINVDEARDSKFPPFRRLDTKFMSRLYLYPICHFCIIKLIIVFGVIFFVAGGMTLVATGLKETEECRGWRRKANRVLAHIVARAIVWGTTGALFVQRERPENVCYKKYLGPEWKPDYDGKHCGTVISNHGAFIDSLVHAEC